MHFIRFLDIKEEHHAGLINNAVGFTVNRSSDTYDFMSRKLKGWRNNWFHKYIKASRQIQQTLEKNGSLGDLPYVKYDKLREAYLSKFSCEYVSIMMANIHVGTIDWQKTLEKPQCRMLYKNVFTYTMLYVTFLLSPSLTNHNMLTKSEVSPSFERRPKKVHEALDS